MDISTEQNVHNNYYNNATKVGESRCIQEVGVA